MAYGCVADGCADVDKGEAVGIACCGNGGRVYLVEDAADARAAGRLVGLAHRVHAGRALKRLVKVRDVQREQAQHDCAGRRQAGRATRRERVAEAAELGLRLEDERVYARAQLWELVADASEEELRVSGK